MKCIPLRIVDFDAAQPNRLFGKRPESEAVLKSTCQTILAIEVSESTLLYLALKDDFGFVLKHRDELLYSDNNNVIIQEIPATVAFSDGPELYPVLSLQKQGEIVDDDSFDLADIHKIGGSSFWLSQYPNPALQFIAQLSFPDVNDVAPDVDWPTGEYTIEMFKDKATGKHCLLWRMHA